MTAMRKWIFLRETVTLPNHFEKPTPSPEALRCNLKCSKKKTPPTFRWPIVVRQVIAAPAERVWETISSPGHFGHIHPFCEKNLVETWSGVGSSDTVYFFRGWIFYRVITHWIDGVGYDLDVTQERPDYEGKTSKVTWRIHDIDGAKSALTITMKCYLYQTMPWPFRWFVHHIYVRPMIKRYLGYVLKGLEAYITTGQPVRKNQFGTHWIFSPKRRG